MTVDPTMLSSRSRLTDIPGLYSCRECDMVCATQSDLHSHLKRSHRASGPTVHTCPYCQREYTDRHRYDIHLRLHTGERPFKCEICGKGFREKRKCNLHTLRHTSSLQHKCHLCPRSFEGPKALQKHVNAHKNNRTIAPKTIIKPDGSEAMRLSIVNASNQATVSSSGPGTPVPRTTEPAASSTVVSNEVVPSTSRVSEESAGTTISLTVDELMEYAQDVTVVQQLHDDSIVMQDANSKQDVFPVCMDEFNGQMEALNHAVHNNEFPDLLDSNHELAPLFEQYSQKSIEVVSSSNVENEDDLDQEDRTFTTLSGVEPEYDSADIGNSVFVARKSVAPLPLSSSELRPDLATKLTSEALAQLAKAKISLPAGTCLVPADAKCEPLLDNEASSQSTVYSQQKGNSLNNNKQMSITIQYKVLAAANQQQLQSSGDCSKSELLMSEDTSRKEEPQKTCNICHLKFSTEVQMRSHFKRHGKHHRFKCMSCGVSYKREDMLRAHMRMHTGQDHFSCNICGKELASEKKWRAHKEKHSLHLTHQCEICNVCFQSKSQLLNHMVSHTRTTRVVGAKISTFLESFGASLEVPLEQSSSAPSSDSGLDVQLHHMLPDEQTSLRLSVDTNPDDLTDANSVAATKCTETNGNLEQEKKTSRAVVDFDALRRKWMSKTRLLRSQPIIRQRKRTSVYAVLKRSNPTLFKNGCSYECILCNQQLHSMSSVVVHKLTKHEGRSWRCQFCSEMHSNRCDLKAHLHSKHRMSNSEMRMLDIINQASIFLKSKKRSAVKGYASSDPKDSVNSDYRTSNTFGRILSHQTDANAGHLYSNNSSDGSQVVATFALPPDLLEVIEHNSIVEDGLTLNAGPIDIVNEDHVVEEQKNKLIAMVAEKLIMDKLDKKSLKKTKKSKKKDKAGTKAHHEFESVENSIKYQIGCNKGDNTSDTTTERSDEKISSDSVSESGGLHNSVHTTNNARSTSSATFSMPILDDFVVEEGTVKDNGAGREVVGESVAKEDTVPKVQQAEDNVKSDNQVLYTDKFDESSTTKEDYSCGTTSKDMDELPECEGNISDNIDLSHDVDSSENVGGSANNTDDFITDVSNGNSCEDNAKKENLGQKGTPTSKTPPSSIPLILVEKETDTMVAKKEGHTSCAMKPHEERVKAEEKSVKAEEESVEAEEESVEAEAESVEAQEERAKAEEEREKAEEERAQPNEDISKAEEERAKAEMESRKAEEERAKAEVESRKAKEEKAKERKHREQPDAELQAKYDEITSERPDDQAQSNVTNSPKENPSESFKAVTNNNPIITRSRRISEACSLSQKTAEISHGKPKRRRYKSSSTALAEYCDRRTVSTPEIVVEPLTEEVINRVSAMEMAKETQEGDSYSISQEREVANEKHSSSTVLTRASSSIATISDQNTRLSTSEFVTYATATVINSTTVATGSTVTVTKTRKKEITGEPSIETKLEKKPTLRSSLVEPRVKLGIEELPGKTVTEKGSLKPTSSVNSSGKCTPSTETELSEKIANDTGSPPVSELSMRKTDEQSPTAATSEQERRITTELMEAQNEILQRRETLENNGATREISALRKTHDVNTTPNGATITPVTNFPTPPDPETQPRSLPERDQQATKSEKEAKQEGSSSLAVKASTTETSGRKRKSSKPRKFAAIRVLTPGSFKPTENIIDKKPNEDKNCSPITYKTQNLDTEESGRTRRSTRKNPNPIQRDSVSQRGELEHQERHQQENVPERGSSNSYGIHENVQSEKVLECSEGRKTNKEAKKYHQHQIHHQLRDKDQDDQLVTNSQGTEGGKQKDDGEMNKMPKAKEERPMKNLKDQQGSETKLDEKCSKETDVQVQPNFKDDQEKELIKQHEKEQRVSFESSNGRACSVTETSSTEVVEKQLDSSQPEEVEEEKTQMKRGRKRQGKEDRQPAVIEKARRQQNEAEISNNKPSIINDVVPKPLESKGVLKVVKKRGRPPKKKVKEQQPTTRTGLRSNVHQIREGSELRDETVQIANSKAAEGERVAVPPGSVVLPDELCIAVELDDSDGSGHVRSRFVCQICGEICLKRDKINLHLHTEHYTELVSTLKSQSRPTDLGKEHEVNNEVEVTPSQPNTNDSELFKETEEPSRQPPKAVSGSKRALRSSDKHLVNDIVSEKASNANIKTTSTKTSGVSATGASSEEGPTTMDTKSGLSIDESKSLHSFSNTGVITATTLKSGRKTRSGLRRNCVCDMLLPDEMQSLMYALMTAIEQVLSVKRLRRNRESHLIPEKVDALLKLRKVAKGKVTKMKVENLTEQLVMTLVSKGKGNSVEQMQRNTGVKSPDYHLQKYTVVSGLTDTSIKLKLQKGSKGRKESSKDKDKDSNDTHSSLSESKAPKSFLLSPKPSPSPLPPQSRSVATVDTSSNMSTTAPMSSSLSPPPLLIVSINREEETTQITNLKKSPVTVEGSKSPSLVSEPRQNQRRRRYGGTRFCRSRHPSADHHAKSREIEDDGKGVKSETARHSRRRNDVTNIINNHETVANHVSKESSLSSAPPPGLSLMPSPTATNAPIDESKPPIRLIIRPKLNPTTAEAAAGNTYSVQRESSNPLRLRLKSNQQGVEVKNETIGKEQGSCKENLPVICNGDDRLDSKEAISTVKCSLVSQSNEVDDDDDDDTIGLEADTFAHVMNVIDDDDDEQ